MAASFPTYKRASVGSLKLGTLPVAISIAAFPPEVMAPPAKGLE